jgi:two-component system, OmpR family, sensor histidine kinase KdpD
MSRTRGRLRVYLGMAPGVGKTYAMLEEAHRRVARGEDVVVGFVETYGRPGTKAVLEGLEAVPRWRVEHRGVTVEEMDTEAVLRRAPAVALIDELAHSNAPGSARARRWEDIAALRDAGIDVISTCNVQHLASVADVVEALIQIPVHERVPDEVLRGADEIELIDLSPDRLRRRMSRGDVYPPERASVALERFFSEGNLTALRDLSLRFVAGRVGAELLAGLTAGEPTAEHPAGMRVMVVLDGTAASPRVLRRAALLAEQLRAPLLALLLSASPANPADAGGSRIDQTAADAANVGAEVLYAQTSDVADTIADLARERGVTHLVLAQTHRRRLAPRVGASLVDRVLRLAPELEVSLVGPGRPAPEVRSSTF